MKYINGYKARHCGHTYFIRGGNSAQDVTSDQLLFSRYAFANINYVKDEQHSFLITSQWQLPFNEVNLYSLHPPSPRNEVLWQTRNRTLYQLKYALNQASEDAIAKEVLPKELLSEEVVFDDELSANSALLKSSLDKNSIVIGDLNLSKHSSRINHLTQAIYTYLVWVGD